MADIFTKAKRSAVMARIRGRGNKDTELALAGLLRREKITGWRRQRAMFGRPDFIFPAARVAVFVDGCFWHACPRHATQPRNNAAFWRQKLARNRQRDRLVTATLKRSGWKVVRIWECSLRQRPAMTLHRLRRALAQ